MKLPPSTRSSSYSTADCPRAGARTAHRRLCAPYRPRRMPYRAGFPTSCVPHAHRRTHGTFRNIAQPVEVACRDLAFEKAPPKARARSRSSRRLSRKCKACARYKSRAALADGVAVYALVTAYDLPWKTKLPTGEPGSCRREPGDIVLSGMKHISMLSGLCATGSPVPASLRTCFFKSAERRVDGRAALGGMRAYSFDRLRAAPVQNLFPARA